MALFYYKEKKNKGIRAAAYLRLSIEDGDKAESNSIGNQRELIQNFVAERPELHLVGEYADDGYTGTNFERPGFTQMMEDIQSDKINCIIVKDLSRLGRNYIEMGKYLERIFPMMGIRFIAINDNYDNANTESSDSDSIVVPFKNLLNDSYCRDISIKVRSQLDIKRRKGEFIGGYAVYGYSKDEQNKNRLVVDEYAADIVRSIYRRKLEGMSANSIADQLNSEGVLAPSEYKRLCGLNYHSGFKTGTHAKWQAIQVLRILKNEVYTGTMVQGKRQKINYKIKKIRDVDESCSTYCLSLSLLLAFAMLYPEVQVLLFFVIPVRVKYFGFFAAILWVLSFLGAPLPQKLSLLLSMANVWLFFGPMGYRAIRAWVRREQWKRKNRR